MSRRPGALHRAVLRSLPVLAATLASCNETISPPEYRLPELAIVAGATPVTQTVYTTVPVAPVVIATDESGAPMGGVRILFAVTAGGGSVTTQQVVTGTDGVASPMSWRFGTRPGPQELTAAVVSTTVEARVTFTGTALVGAIDELRVEPASVALRPTFTAQATAGAFDAFGNLVAAGVAPAWESRDVAIATVSASGLITAVDNGQTWVVGTYLGESDSTMVVIGTHPTGNDITAVSVPGLPFGVAASSNDRVYVAVYSNLGLRRFDLPSTVPGATLALGIETIDVAFSPTGDLAYAATLSGGVKVVDAVTNTFLRTITGMGEVVRVATSSDGAFIYTTNTSGALHRINASTDQVVTLALGSGVLNGLQLNEPRGVLYATSTDGYIYEVTLSTFALARSRFLGAAPQGVDINPAGSVIYVANEGTGLQIMDAVTFQVTDTRSAYTGAFDVAVTPDGQQLYVTRYWAGDISIVDAVTLLNVRTIPAPGSRRLAVSADGLTVIATAEDGTVRFIR